VAADSAVGDSGASAANRASRHNLGMQPGSLQGIAGAFPLRVKRRYGGNL
jgi:hypothetical protein